MKIRFSMSWCMYVAIFLFGVLVGWGITAYSYLPKYESDMLCPNGETPDKNGCCIGEVYTDMGDLGFNCCPDDGSDCFPPIR